jgi:hypothetical protein
MISPPTACLSEAVPDRYGGVNAALFRRCLPLGQPMEHRRRGAWSRKNQALFSIALWVTVILCGRLLAYPDQLLGGSDRLIENRVAMSSVPVSSGIGFNGPRPGTQPCDGRGRSSTVNSLSITLSADR